MNPLSTAPTAAGTSLLEDFSLEMTGKDVSKLEDAAELIPPGTRINVTFLGNEDLRMRLEAARAVKRLGFRPVPHISARRLGSRADFERFLTGLRDDATGAEVFAVGGDPARPEGPYADSLALIESGLLPGHGVRHVGISGYPEGHPAIPDDVLRAALRDKSAALAAQGLDGGVITQFGFDVDPVLAWVERVRDEGITLPVRIGVPGPAGVRRLMGYAARFGVGTSASIAKKYGLSLTNLMGTAGPDRFLHALADGYDPARHGDVKIHFYTFGGLRATSEWVARFRKEALA
ncbi:putative methylenetetrahydrofolate reductase [Actinacidiphila reveromycinica]|uniref:Putative methylenetetrahydrofolate reductase n=1 Tax=Actinacidiphila reveromycinica TaxID=659352 RepID=A0A7U3UPK4_9ACTN|nr:methylenetetrahydrofolate reductase [Streptomyces sp. SN-593]BBA96337.1 putative methylenetetrahydrofolate reductase [Streptomyces sp. SN-593]